MCFSLYTVPTLSEDGTPIVARNRQFSLIFSCLLLGRGREEEKPIKTELKNRMFHQIIQKPFRSDITHNEKYEMIHNLKNIWNDV